MATRGSFLVVTSLLVLAAIGSGCAKRPATTQAAAPAPTGTASTMAPGSSQPGGTTATPSGPSTSQPGGGATAAPTPAPGPIARPAPKDFAPVPELQDIYFDFDKYDIRPGDAQILRSNAQWLKDNANQLILIEGHCDERGTNEYNMALGERRAKATMNFLVAQGIKADRISIISYGEERPTCTEHKESCWAQNRRACTLVKPQ